MHKREILPFRPEYLAESPARFWGFRNDGPGVVAIYSGVTAGGGWLSEQCVLMPDDVVEVLAANCVVQSRDQLGAVVFFATAE